jgi:hypothetical protein
MRLLRTVRGPLISDFLTKKGEEDADKVGSFAHAHMRFRAVRLSTPSVELIDRNGRRDNFPIVVNGDIPVRDVILGQNYASFGRSTFEFHHLGRTTSRKACGQI